MCLLTGLLCIRTAEPIMTASISTAVSDFVIKNSVMDSDDDCLTLKSTGLAPCENIFVSNCVFSSQCNAIKTGTESTGGFRNVTITHCQVKPSADKTPVNSVSFRRDVDKVSPRSLDGVC